MRPNVDRGGESRTSAWSAFAAAISRRWHHDAAPRGDDAHARKLFEISPDLLCVLDEERRFVEFNDAYVEHFGYAREELRAMSARDLVHPDDLPLVVGEYGARQQLIGYEGRFLAKDGRTVWVEMHSVPADSGLIYSVGRVVTERKVLELRVRRLVLDLDDAHARERQRLAGEIHDFALQNFIAALMRIELLQLGSRRDDPALDDGLAGLERLVREGIAATRRIMQGVAPRLPTDVDLQTALQGGADEIERTHGLPVALHVMTKEEVDEDVQTVIFRLVMEAMRNAGKHASASCVVVTVLSSDAKVTASVIDDGCGFAAPIDIVNRTDEHMGFGMNLMLEQILALGGIYAVHSAPGHGTSVSVSMPARATAPALFVTDLPGAAAPPVTRE